MNIVGNNPILSARELKRERDALWERNLDLLFDNFAMMRRMVKLNRRNEVLRRRLRKLRRQLREASV